MTPLKPVVRDVVHPAPKTALHLAGTTEKQPSFGPAWIKLGAVLGIALLLGFKVFPHLWRSKPAAKPTLVAGSPHLANSRQPPAGGVVAAPAAVIGGQSFAADVDADPLAAPVPGGAGNFMPKEISRRRVPIGRPGRGKVPEPPPETPAVKAPKVEAAVAPPFDRAAALATLRGLSPGVERCLGAASGASSQRRAFKVRITLTREGGVFSVDGRYIDHSETTPAVRECVENLITETSFPPSATMLTFPYVYRL